MVKATDLTDCATARTDAANERIPATLSLIGLLEILRERKWLVLLCLVGGALVSATIALLLPVKYTATAVIMPPQQAQSAASSLLGQLGPIAGLAGRDLGLKSPSDLYVGVAKSRTIQDALIRRFDLKKLYRSQTLVEARKKLSSYTSFETGKDTLIRISVEDRDPQRAAEMANAYVEELYTQNSRLALTDAAQRRQFFQRRLDTEKDALATAEASLKASQERTGLLAATQVEGTMRALGQLGGEIAGREVALQRLQAGATPDNPEVVRLQAELRGLQMQMQKLRSASPGPGSPFIPTAEVPERSLEHLRRIRELKYHETLYEILAKQYEAARIDEAKEAPALQVVDYAIAPDQKSWPPRALYTLTGTLASFAASILYCIVRTRPGNPPVSALRNTH